MTLGFTDVELGYAYIELEQFGSRALRKMPHAQAIIRRLRDRKWIIKDHRGYFVSNPSFRDPIYEIVSAHANKEII